MTNRLILIAVIALTLAACGAQPSAPAPTAVPVATTSSAPTASGQGLRPITLAMSYIPNVQFAPYYVAAAKGYYKDAGLDVTFDYNFENDVVQRAASWPESKVAFATASGTSVLLARQQGLPVKTVETLYQKFPVVFFAKSSTGLKSVNDLKGKTVGIPGRFGESLYALMAVLYANKLDETAMTVQEIGFTQAQTVLEGKVQVGIGYAMNEPVILRQQNQQVDVLRVADIYNLASNGIVVSEALITQEPDLVHRFVQASLRGLRDTLDNPDEAYTLSLTFIPEAKLGDPKLQRQVLQESLPFWQSDKTTSAGLGFTDVDVWTKTEQFMRDAKLLTNPVDVNSAFTNDFIK
ncbi:MAG: ABC transporter substrate-binding protein [Chloroflexales bacterium]